MARDSSWYVAVLPGFSFPCPHVAARKWYVGNVVIILVRVSHPNSYVEECPFFANDCGVASLALLLRRSLVVCHMGPVVRGTRRGE